MQSAQCLQTYQSRGMRWKVTFNTLLKAVLPFAPVRLTEERCPRIIYSSKTCRSCLARVRRIPNLSPGTSVERALARLPGAPEVKAA